MTKKHFEAIADIMKRYSHHPDWIPTKLAEYFATINQNFDHYRFLKACGIDENEL